jgi:hypothetical protein
VSMFSSAIPVCVKVEACVCFILEHIQLSANRAANEGPVLCLVSASALRDLRVICATCAARDGRVMIALKVSIHALVSPFILSAICSEGCLYGTCAVPGICTCNEGYSGAICTERMPSFHSVSHLTAVCSSCVNGECTAPGVCMCNEGWSGSGCSQGKFLSLVSPQPPSNLHRRLHLW